MTNDSREIEMLLQQLVNLTAALVSDGKSMRDAALRLSACGLAPKQIAEILRTTRNTISVELSKARKGARNEKQR